MQAVVVDGFVTFRLAWILIRLASLKVDSFVG